MAGSADDLADFLAADGLGLTVTTNLFVGEMPDTPAICVAMLEYPGRPTLHKAGTEVANLIFPSVQAKIRHTSYATGFALAEGIHRSLSKIANETVGSGYYLAVEPNQYPGLLEQDDNRNWIFVVNFDVTRVAT